MPPASMSGKICIVTGANSGIGKETALGLAQMGARVIMVCRNVEKGKVALEEIQRESGSSQVDLLIADMSSQTSLRALAEEIQQKYPPGRVGQQRRRWRAGSHAFRGRHRNDAFHQSSGPRATDASLARSVEGQRASAHHQCLVVGGSTPCTPRHERSPVRAAEIPWLRRLWTVETADEHVYVRAGAEAGGNWSHRELPPSRRGSVEFLERQFAAAHRQADPRCGEAVHAEFKTGRRVSLYLAASPEVAQVSGEFFVKSKPAKSNPLSRDPKLMAEVWLCTEKVTGLPLA
jgi:NAD(P)-dependent dehydrogenase (short-subunit alcohol dehydrogenase family)